MGLRALIDFIRLFDGSLLVDDRADRADHARRVVGLEDIPPHVDADGAVAHRVGGELQRLELRRLLAAGDDDGNRTALDELVEILAMIGLDDMRAELGGDAAGEAQSEEHTSELQSPYVISYAVFCLKKKK